MRQYRDKNSGQIGKAWELDQALTLGKQIVAFNYKNSEGKTITRFVDKEKFNQEYEEWEK